jgi:hypothetical protein
MTKAERIQDCKELIGHFAAVFAETFGTMIRNCPPGSHTDLWHHAHAAMETAIRERLEKGPTS